MNLKNFCQKNLPQTNTNNMDKLIASLVEKTITKYITVVSEKFELDSEELSAMWSEVSGIKKRAKSTKRSGYMLFCSDERSSIKKASPDMKPSAVMKELGGRWKKLSEKKQQVWREKANVPVKDGDWVNMTTAQLKEACKTQKLKSTGNKAKLIERLENPDDDGNQSDSGTKKTGLAGMTVKELKAECKKTGVEKYSKLKKNELIEKLSLAKGKLSSEVVVDDDSDNEDEPVPSNSDYENDTEDGEVVDDEEVDYSKMTVKDLKAECKKKGLEKYSKMKKAELVEILQKSDGSDDGSDDDCDDCQDSSNEEEVDE